MTGLASLTAVAAGAVAYMQVTVPLAGPSLARGDVSQYWSTAVIAGLVVLIATSAVVWLVLAASRKENE
jgi:type VI protein secretion system component VasK